ncbi:hypothetical protein [Aurantimonas endophytica]|uniref:Helix-turn-helix protein n=1 Tax=Aurantimonas endophytica TaxID=1522175 RepID=A0A7W6MPP9_9HYPH|nr:hypothetical protein [Aurantimonas endophytica]MBB4003170.1 hypothetical protein [Aurantimonas endophytica]MCO6404041.1 hypothetical protein [Aurantimonas endophytica]
MRRVDRELIDLVVDKPADYHRGLEAFRAAVNANPRLPKVAHQVASGLASNINRHFGYTWRTDQQIADEIGTSKRNVGKAMLALDNYGHIVRQTKFRQADDHRAGGRMRRIHLCVPTEIPTAKAHARNAIVRNKRQNEQNTSAGMNGTNRVDERNDLRRITCNHITPDTSGLDIVKVGSYAGAGARETVSSIGLGWSDDESFLSVFDDLMRSSLRQVDSINPNGPNFLGLVGKAFDDTTASSDLFAPIDWRMACAVREGTVRSFFLNRARVLADGAGAVA